MVVGVFSLVFGSGRKEFKPPAALVLLGRIAKVQSEGRHENKPISAAKF